MEPISPLVSVVLLPRRHSLVSLSLFAYCAVFAGAAGHTYGCNPVFQFYDPSRQPALSSPMAWQRAIDLPGALQIAPTVMFEDDWVLVIDNADVGYPPPGGAPLQ